MPPNLNVNTKALQRKSIYDFLSGELNITKEIHKLSNMFEEWEIIRMETEFRTINYTLEKYVASIFLQWNGRGSYLSPAELKQDMGITDIKRKIPNEEQTTLYLEYLLNMLRLFENKYRMKPYSIQIQTSAYQALQDNISLLLSQLNLKKVKNTQGIIILVPENPEVAEVVDIIEKRDVKLAILEYNHITNRTNLTEKQKILHVLAKDFEPRRGDLEKIKEWKSLASDLGFLFNTLDIRHNNTEGMKAIPAIQQMNGDSLLRWCDITYRLYLTAVLLHDYIMKEQTEITSLKQRVNPK